RTRRLSATGGSSNRARCPRPNPDGAQATWRTPGRAASWTGSSSGEIPVQPAGSPFLPRAARSKGITVPGRISYNSLTLCGASREDTAQASPSRPVGGWAGDQAVTPHDREEPFIREPGLTVLSGLL